jgi:hypothetical protein
MKIQVYNHVFRQPAKQVQVDKTEGILPYGKDNSFPLRLAKLVQESPTASSAVSILSDFIEGNGFSDPTLKDKIINSRGDKFGSLHSLTSESFALFRGFAWLLKFNINGDVTEIFSIPFENCRLGEPDSQGIISKIKVNPYYGTPLFETKHTKEYWAYSNDPAVVRSQMTKEGKKFGGQILYFGTTSPLSRFYPRPEYYSAKSWMAIDAGIQEYHENNLDAGFFQTVLLKMIGDPDQPSTHPDDQETDDSGNNVPIRSRGERFNIEMQKFTGSESKTKMLVLWEQLKDQMPELQAFPQITNENFFTNLQDKTDQKILMAMKIPAILVNIGRENSLSDGAQMANATRVMHDRVAKPQNLLESVYKDVLSRFVQPYTQEIKIVNTNSFQELDQIDPSIWEVLTIEEKRKWVKENTEYPVLAAAPVAAPVAAPSNFKDIYFTDYPAAAKANAKRALDFQNSDCGTPMGKRRGKDIADGHPLSFKDIKSIYSYLKRNQGSKDKTWATCDAVLFHMWGGQEMLDYCADKIKMINE